MCIRDRYIVAVLAIIAAFSFGFYRGRVTAPEKIIEKEVPVEHIAVSYTHLDVYKRQELDIVHAGYRF